MKYRTHLLVISVLMLTVGLTQCKKNPTVPNANVLNMPVIWVDTFEMSFAASITGSNPSAQILKIKNSGRETLNYSMVADAEWISVIEDEGTSTGQTIEHTILIDKAGLPAQEEPHTAKITVTSSNAYNNPQEVTVSLFVSEEPPPTIRVTPKKLAFSGQVKGSNPSFQNISIQNTGGDTLKFEVTTDKSWLSVDPDSGQSKDKEKSVKVNVDTKGLNEGTYRGKIQIVDPKATNSPQTVDVTLNMTKDDPPRISVNPSRLSFQAFTTGSNPASQNLSISNSGEGTLNYSIDWDAGWLSVSPNSGTSGGAVRQHTASVNKSGLSAGTYRDTIRVSDPNASNSPYTVDVTLTISPPLTDNQVGISLSPTSGGTDTIVSVAITVRGNLSPIQAYGIQVNFNTTMFQYVSTSSGNLTGSWALVDGNQATPGVITVGGIAGGAAPIPIGSLGTIAVVRLRVTCGSCSDNQTSQITISSLSDDIAGMIASPSSATFTYKQ